MNRPKPQRKPATPTPDDAQLTSSLILTDRDRDAFLAALENPPDPSPKLLRAVAAYKSAVSRGKLRCT